MTYFNGIIGHEKIKEHLQDAIVNNTLSHAYIFNGENGCGKLLLAKTLATALVCQADDARPCGKCTACMQAASGNHPDIRFVTHEKPTIGVDDIRNQITADMQIKPYSSEYKIYIIPDGNRMTEQAQNALLKSMEEPPSYVRMILLTENISSMLQTILSRCVTLNLKPVQREAIVEFLVEKKGIPRDVAITSAAFSQGNIGKAIRYALSEDFIEMKQETVRLLKYVDDMEIPDILSAIKRFGEHKYEINDYIDLMILWYRDVLMFKVTKDANLLLYKGEYQSISKQASIREYSQIENILHAMEKAKQRIAANVNFDTTMELMLLTMKE